MISQRVARWLDERTQPNRQRAAAALFMMGAGRPRPWDELISRLDFALTSAVLAKKAVEPEHLAPFAAGLEHCPEPAAALDIGTGVGGSAALMATRWPTCQVEAIDTAAPMLAAARRLHSQPNLTFTRASSVRLPFGDNTFGLVTTLNAVAELEELCRVATADAHVLSAFSFGRGRPDALDQLALARWAQMGFTRVVTGEAGAGWWELLRRRPSGS